MNRSIQWIAASVLLSTAIALLWLNAPVVPAMTGAVAAGMLMYVRTRRTAS